MAQQRVLNQDIPLVDRAPETAQIRVMRARARLKYEHALLTMLLNRYEKLGQDDVEAKRALFQEIKMELRLHTRVEEDVFFPELHDAQLRHSGPIVAEGLRAHKTLRNLLDEMSALLPGEASFEVKMDALKARFLEHASDQEDCMFRLFNSISAEIQGNLATARGDQRRGLRRRRG